MLDIIAGFLIAVLSGLGVGSGGLFVIYLTLISGAPQLAAQGMNLLFFFFSSGASMLIHLNKRKILWNAVFFLTVVAVAGALLGSFFAGVIPTAVIRKIFGAFLIVSGVISIFSKKRKKRVPPSTD